MHVRQWPLMVIDDSKGHSKCVFQASFPWLDFCLRWLQFKIAAWLFTWPLIYVVLMSQMQIQLWKIVLHPLGFELWSFGLRDQCSTELVKGDVLQPSQYQATGSYKHLWHIPPPRGISSSRLEVQSHFCQFDKEYFATQRNTESTLERHCHRCKYNCEKLYCARWDSNPGPLVYEISALPN